MNPLLIYMVKAALCMTVLYIIYYSFLSRDTMYSRNRIFILLSFALSLILPAISIETRQPNDLQVFGRDLTGMTITGTTAGSSSESFSFDWQYLLLIIYITGLIAAGLKLMIEIISLLMLITRQKRDEKNIISLSNSRTSGFSAFGHIFIDRSLEPDEAEEIIRHEQKHLDRFHFVDIILSELLKVVQWFNPFIYMFDRSLRAVHEYQADEECLNSGIPVHSYQGLVMNQVFRARIFNPSNSFSNPTLIKKRMIMMTKKRSKALANLKILLVVPGLAVLLILFSTCSEKITNSDIIMEEVTPTSTAAVTKSGEQEPFVVVEEMPMFPGSDTALLRYLAENTKYPQIAKENNIQGRVIVRFCVTETGDVDRITVLKGVSPELDAEAARVVSTLPAFKPGKQGGKDVPVWYMVPITFALGGKLPDVATLAPPPPPPPPADFVVVQETKGTGSEPFVVVEEMPMFPGGDTALLSFFAKNVNYPEYAKTNKITGRVILRFCISAKGNVEQISVIKAVDPSLDAEAMRVASTLPQFRPGKQGGKPVPVWYMVPVTFALK
ncbi:MAG: M56 family metallopeptidase [Bacteroidia bacterium]|nr:M56 family metallopeptidase [Bacteroidia bacterium]